MTGPISAFGGLREKPKIFITTSDFCNRAVTVAVFNKLRWNLNDIILFYI